MARFPLRAGGVVTLALCAAALGACAPAGVRISGTILGHDGRPRVGAHAWMRAAGTVAAAPTDREGRFTLEVRVTGLRVLRLGAPFHRTLEVPLLLEGGDRVDLEARLRAVRLEGAPSAPRLIGSFNDFRWSAGAIPLVEQHGGRLTATIPRSPREIRYLVRGLDARGAIQGTFADRFAFDPAAGESGAIVSVIDATPGPREVTFDPTLLPRSDADAEVRLTDAAGRRAGRLVAVHRESQARWDRFAARARADADDPSQEAFEAREIARRIAAEREPDARAYLSLHYLTYLSAETADALMARRVLEEVPADSPLWSAEIGLLDGLGRLAKILGDDAAPYVGRVASIHPDDAARAAALYALSGMAGAGGRPDEAGALADRVLREFPVSEEAADVRMTRRRDDLRGRPLPEFAVPSLHDARVVLKNGTIRGKTCLIVFWATWCGPCVGELDALDRLMKAHRDEGFTILSLSLDADPETVTRFQAGRSMPWEHAHLPGGFDHPLARRFTVEWVPYHLLVDEAGIVRRSPADLMWDVAGEVERYLSGAPPS